MPIRQITIPQRYKNLRAAVCCAIRQNKELGSKLLLVSRKDDPDNFGLPGGKVDPGETPEQAVVREVKEETGLDIDLGPCIFKRMCEKHAPEGEDFYAFAFVAKGYSGELSSNEKGVIKWGTWEDQKHGNFADYNRGVRAALVDYDWLVDSWRTLNKPENREGIRIMQYIRNSVSFAPKIAAELGLDRTFTVNALLNLNNAGLVQGLESGPYRLTLTGEELLQLGSTL